MEKEDGRHSRKERRVRFIFTMHMPSAKGSMIHQIFGDYNANSLEEMLEILSGQDFILVRQFYKDGSTLDGDLVWIDKGNIILNTHHVGKVQVHVPENVEASTIRKYNTTVRR